jgi:magnesium transporter
VVHDEAIQFNTLFLHTLDGIPHNTNVCIIICEKRVICLSARELPACRLLRMRSAHDPTLIDDPESIALNLMEIKVDGLADELEDATRKLENLSSQVLRRTEVDFEEALDVLAVQEDLNGKVMVALMDTQRDLTFLLRRGRFDTEQVEWIQELLRDVDTLLPHNTFLTEKVNFLLNSAMGFINLEQNKIIKTFSIAAVVFLPPTLVASIYGMNFDLMPELHLPWGYPLAVLLMIVSAITPYLYFKRKGWL